MAVILLILVAFLSAAAFSWGPSIIKSCAEKIDEWREVLTPPAPPVPGKETVCMACPYSELAQRGETHDCNNCGNERRCEYRPGWGKPVKMDCPLWRADK